MTTRLNGFDYVLSAPVCV